jgi:hypothetical protein
VIQDVARFNPTVGGPPQIFIFREGRCTECDDETIARAKSEVEYESTLAKMMYEILNEKNSEKIAKLTEILQELKKSSITPQDGTGVTTQI